MIEGERMFPFGIFINSRKKVSANMDQTVAFVGTLRDLLGNIYGMYFRAHSAHWNIEGPLFGPLHELFSELYHDTFDSADMIAEAIRFHRYYTPDSIQAIAELSKVNAIPLKSGNPKLLLEDLYQANALVLESLKRAKDAAAMAKDTGMENKMDERIFAHDKWAWKLRSTMKSLE
jgi:starvation-inducible DNA-binding protein